MDPATLVEEGQDSVDTVRAPSPHRSLTSSGSGPAPPSTIEAAAAENDTIGAAVDAQEQRHSVTRRRRGVA